MAKRYFEFVDDSSSKFWEVWVDGVQVFTRYGKIGATGQTTIKDEGAADKAQKLHDKLVKEKTGKGYVEKTGGGAAPAPAAAAPKAAPPVAAKPAKAEKVAAPSAPPPAAPAGGSPGFRRFEFTEGGSNKFWEIRVEGSGHTVRFGKVGTLGQEKTKDFGSEDGAAADAAKLINEKTKKGYAEVEAAPSAPPPPPLDAKELAAALKGISDAGNDPAPFLVFADWLEAKGHPWGKLIALHHAMATADSAAKKKDLERAETALLREHGAAVVGPLLRTKGTRFEWHYGFITHATLGSPTDKPVLAANLKTLLELPAATLLSGLTLDPIPKDLPSHQEWDESADDVAEVWPAVLKGLQLPPRVKTLSIGSRPPVSASAYVALPDAGLVSLAAAKVEALTVTGSGEAALGFKLPALKSLELNLANANDAQLESLKKAELPKLERLSVNLGGLSYCVLDDVYQAEEYDEDNEDGERYPARYPVSDLDEMEVHEVTCDVTPAAVTALLSGKQWDGLKHLGITSANLKPEMVKAISQSPLLPKLETLDLSGAAIRDDGVAALIAEKMKWVHLKEINFERSTLNEANAKKLVDTFPKAKVGEQRASDPEFFMRYVATME